MPPSLIYLGQAPNDGTGDPANTAFGLANDWFTFLNGDKAEVNHTHAAADISDLAAAVAAILLSLPTTQPSQPNKLWWNGGFLARS